ncbi:DUF4870 domain-containing protein [Paenalkalicoccus suaedae]|uniref:DUF4870 domain-containing protein n=1 Tax=Paenalkalicoccus suaedae TaxID=2592382 RepID=A0A859FDM4_9BACI|nr:DUF4870 domain-containing protein [Paenalkalicoccus suaedae]QKS70355.1 DUF4870 domain-containing protein [Paenalkalicoccus suaedae]
MADKKLVSVPGTGRTASGMDQNLAALLTYLLGFITGIIFLFIEKENQYVRYHAMQSTIMFGFLFVLSMVVGIIPLIGWLISLLITPLTLVIWIYAMYKAYNGQRFKFPFAGDMAEAQLKKM